MLLADTAFWTGVLDELEARLASAENGDTGALSGWTTPPAAPRPMNQDEAARASDILERQRALTSVLTAQRAKAGAALASMRRPKFRVAVPPPVYVDRSF